MQQVEDTSSSASESFLPAGTATTPVVIPARKCGRDNPSYESRLGLSCSEHVERFDQTLEVGSIPCDAYAIIGFAPDEMAALKWHCLCSCGIDTQMASVVRPLPRVLLPIHVETMSHPAGTTKIVDRPTRICFTAPTITLDFPMTILIMCCGYLALTNLWGWR